MEKTALTNEQIKWCNEHIKGNWAVNDHKEVYVEKTYDVEFRDTDSITNFPVQFAKCNDFNCSRCKNLKSLKGGPKDVQGIFNCSRCESLTDLVGAPSRTGSNFLAYDCKSLVSTKGAPMIMGYMVPGATFDVSKCHNLVSLQDFPMHVAKLDISESWKIKNINPIRNCQNALKVEIYFSPKIYNHEFEKDMFEMKNEYLDLLVNHVDDWKNSLMGAYDYVRTCKCIKITKPSPEKLLPIEIKEWLFKHLDYISYDFGLFKVNEKGEIYTPWKEIHLYDSNDSLTEFPVQFADCDVFDCRDCSKLKSLKGAPVHVKKTINLSGCVSVLEAEKIAYIISFHGQNLTEHKNQEKNEIMEKKETKNQITIEFKNGMKVTGTLEQVMKIANDYGEPFDESKCYYSKTKEKLILLKDMNSQHIKNAIMKTTLDHYSTIDKMQTSREFLNEYFKLENDENLKKLIKELSTRTD